MAFKDYFSQHSAEYAVYRPRYPDALFSYLASLSPRRDRAWDCATGNGQAAIGLVPYFREVIATDPSRSQLDNAISHPQISYRQEPAEACSIEENSIDLVTVSLALHWLDRPQFYGQVRRVLKPNGIVAAWCYGVLRVSPEVDTIVDRIYSEILDKYWFPERRAIEDQYRSMDFPFEEVQPPSFSLSRTWSLEEVAGHIKTWSASQRYRSENHRDPVDLVGAELAAAWGIRT